MRGWLLVLHIALVLIYATCAVMYLSSGAILPGILWWVGAVLWSFVAGSSLQLWLDER